MSPKYHAFCCDQNGRSAWSAVFLKISSDDFVYEFVIELLNLDFHLVDWIR